MHPPGAGGLLPGTPGQRALELEQGAADLVADGGVALLVMDRGGDGNVGAVRRSGTRSAAEDVRAARAGGDGVGHGAAAGAEERHVDLGVLGCFGCWCLVVDCGLGFVMAVVWLQLESCCA